MNEQPAPASPPRRRGEKQERSLARRARLADAIVQVLASHGVAGLTHRLVAQAAGVSLAATTYYFDSKFDMVAVASNLTLAGYAETFRRVARSRQLSMGDYVTRLVGNAAERDRARATCWAEVMLDAPRHQESLELSRRWFAELGDIWLDIARACDAPPPAARSAIDTSIGLLLVMLALGLTEAQIGAVLLEGKDALDAWAPTLPAAGGQPVAAPAKPTRKSAGTRERIIAAAIQILIAEGPAAVTYRTIAQQAGLTLAGPAYHFPTVEGLLGAAQERLFEESKQRYRTVVASMDDGPFDLERLIDRTAAVFLREATEHAGRNLASYAVWLQAARRPELRPMVWSAIADQIRAWHRVFVRLGGSPTPLEALLPQCMFIGKMIRLLATGSALADLENARRDFAFDLSSLAGQRFWLRPKTGTHN
ncbi:TetR/AcrR family transcriptional regulator [Niveispirillum fermenti]|uniref:TetR/AcrR family transcriptional regulator n=1 Tax=Niveispirillum fermenti TaxID=1233113 RepID=UPI003A8BAF74